MIRLRACCRRQDGSPTILGLAVMAGLVLPLVAVLWLTASISNSSQAAQGIAYSVSYATMSRAIDLGQTSATDSPGGVVLNQIDPAVYQEAQHAVNAASYVASAGIVDTNLSLSARADRAPYRPADQPLGYDPPVGIVNVPAAPEGNRSYVGIVTGGSCNDGVVMNILVGNRFAACWTDIRARDWNSDQHSRNPVSRDGGRATAWDHYASGAEAEVAFSTNLWMFGGFTGYRQGVSSFGRPCVLDSENCTQ